MRWKRGPSSKWLKSEGDEVEEGDAIAEIETDKVSMELEAEDSGTLAQILGQDGAESVPVGDAIAFIQGEGEEVPDREASGGGEEEAEAEEGGEDGGGAQATATETEEGLRKKERLKDWPRSSGGGAQANGQADGQANGNFRASPIVRRLAQENDLDLGKVDGFGSAGPDRRAGRAGRDGARRRPGRRRSRRSRSSKKMARSRTARRSPATRSRPRLPRRPARRARK